MDTLHLHNYDLAEAISSLVPSTGPVLCRDEMEEWSASEANLFEEALEKYGKDFNDIRQDFVSTSDLLPLISLVGYKCWQQQVFVWNLCTFSNLVNPQLSVELVGTET